MSDHRVLPALRLCTRGGREGNDDHTAAALKAHALRTELDAIEARAVAEGRDLADDEAARVEAIREQAKAMREEENAKRSILGLREPDRAARGSRV